VKCRRILEEPHSEEGLRELVSCINAGGSMPPLFDSISNNIKSYVSLFISPYRSGEEELKSIELYPASSLSGPSRSCFDLLLMEIKWHLKYKDRENYIKKCDQFIGVATKYFGEFHPIFSELYDLFSSYHISSHELEDATTFAKSSLVNILKVCGTGHGKTSECYYNLALCYIRCGKKEEAFSHMKKARQIFENNGGASSVPYAAISLKLALIYLNQDQTQDCLLAALTALAIFQAEDLAAYEEELVDCYEMITRCYEITQQKDQIQHIADQCESRLAEISSPHNLERALKIVIYPFLSEVSPQAASSYIDIISQFAFENRS
jgi:tetratricopeptide (TPR) repeat protein